MTVRIGSMVALFANANLSYTAVGMRVTDNASAANSKLFYLEVNNTPRLNVGKDGSLIINADVNTNSSILRVDNKNTGIINLTANLLTINSNVHLSKTTHVKGYSESFKTVTTSNSVVFLNLNEATVFSVTSANNYISRFNFIKPTVPEIGLLDKAYSCTVIVKNITSIPASAWVNVIWPNSVTPVAPGGRTSIYSFINVTDANNVFTNSWYGIDLGSNFTV